jgi:hypothetical protein
LEFWQKNEHIFRDAWIEWVRNADLPDLDEKELIDPKLLQAVTGMWASPSSKREEIVKELVFKILPGVFKFQLFKPESIQLLRRHLDAASKSGIPRRRPNGMNRYGLIIDKETEGGVSYPQVDQFRDWLANRYLRPLGRVFFNEYIGQGDDSEAYAFTIRYKSGEDVQLKEHSDASIVTLNLNLNLPEEIFAGSSLYFLDEDKERHHVIFEPGMAVLHRGQNRHAALPIEQGERNNMVVWLFGKGGYVRFAKYESEEQLDLEERWAREDGWILPEGTSTENTREEGCYESIQKDL